MTIKGALLKDRLLDVVKEMKEKLYKSQAEMGVLTDIPDLDNLIGGFKPLGLYIVGARPNVGKSALLFQFALSAIKRGAKTIVFSLEMTADEVIERMVVNEGKIASSYLTQGGERLMQYERENIETSLGKASESLKRYWDNLTIFDQGMDIEQVVSLTRQQHVDLDVDLVIVDYVGLVKPTGTHFARHLEVGQVSQGLKELAKELKIPVVAGAQVNRAPASSKKSDQRKPGLTDLRESGSLEQDADVVLMLHRERDEDGCFEAVGEALITVAKGRKVRHGVVKTTYIGEQFRFEPVGDTPPAPAPKPTPPPTMYHGHTLYHPAGQKSPFADDSKVHVSSYRRNGIPRGDAEVVQEKPRIENINYSGVPRNPNLVVKQEVVDFVPSKPLGNKHPS